MDKIIAIMVLILMTCGWFFIWSSRRYNKNLPVQTVVASIVRKRIDKWRSSPSSPLITEYFVEFEYPEGKIELKVIDVTTYERLTVGETGTLTYQKNRLYKLYVDFK